MFDQNKNFRSYFDTTHLHVRLVRAFQIVGGSQESLINIACDSVQSAGLLLVLNRGLQLDFEVLQSAGLEEIWGAQIETKNNPKPNVCTLLVDSYSSSQATTTTREIGGRL